MHELTLAPEEGRTPDVFYSRLSVNVVSPELFSWIQENGSPVRKTVFWYADEGVRKTKVDHYGNDLVWLPAGEIADALELAAVSDWDMAVCAYLRALDPGHKILIYWS